jgi:hypothetical protein
MLEISGIFFYNGMYDRSTEEAFSYAQIERNLSMKSIRVSFHEEAEMFI